MIQNCCFCGEQGKISLTLSKSMICSRKCLDDRLASGTLAVLEGNSQPLRIAEIIAIDENRTKQCRNCPDFVIETNRSSSDIICNKCKEASINTMSQLICVCGKSENVNPSSCGHNYCSDCLKQVISAEQCNQHPTPYKLCHRCNQFSCWFQRECRHLTCSVCYPRGTICPYYSQCQNCTKMEELNYVNEKYLCTECENLTSNCENCVKLKGELHPCGHIICRSCFLFVSKCPMCQTSLTKCRGCQNSFEKLSSSEKLCNSCSLNKSSFSLILEHSKSSGPECEYCLENQVSRTLSCSHSLCANCLEESKGLCQVCEIQQPPRAATNPETPFVKCMICQEHTPLHEIIPLPCKHPLCKACTINYMQFSISNNSMNQLKCPNTNCRELLPLSSLQSSLPRELISEFDHKFASIGDQYGEKLM